MQPLTLHLNQPHQTILVTGGTGFIGHHLIKALQLDGHRVIILSRTSVKGLQQDVQEFRMIKSLEQLADDVHIDCIINLAGESIANGRWTAAKKQELISSRIRITENIIALIARLQHKPQVLISGSAIGYYGRQLDDRELSEASLPRDEFTHQLCQQWETCALKAREYGVRVCLSRTGIVLGPDGGALQQMLLPFKLGLGAKIGSGEQWMSWVHIADLIHIFALMINDEQLSGPINATAPTPVKNEEFSRALAHVLHRPCLFTTPTWLLKLVFGEMGDALLLHGQRVIPKKLLEQDFKFNYPIIQLALQDVFG